MTSGLQFASFAVLVSQAFRTSGAHARIEAHSNARWVTASLPLSELESTKSDYGAPMPLANHGLVVSQFVARGLEKFARFGRHLFDRSVGDEREHRLRISE